jgi:hypothetical protein
MVSMTHPQLLEGLKCESQIENSRRARSQATLPGSQGNRVNSWLLVVRNQTANLTPSPSFAHNLCFKCLNGQCKPILDICASIAFQWYKKLFKAMSFDPWNCALKVWESFWDSNSQHGSSFGSVRVHSLTLFALLEACEVTPGSPS